MTMITFWVTRWFAVTGSRSVRDLAESMETETKRFDRRAAARSEDASIRRLLGDLADAEAVHEQRADQIVEENLPASVRAGEDAHARRNFVLRVIQPGLAGLMDGSVSTGARVRRGIRHLPGESRTRVMECISGRHRCLGRRRHLDGRSPRPFLTTAA